MEPETSVLTTNETTTIATTKATKSAISSKRSFQPRNDEDMMGLFEIAIPQMLKYNYTFPWIKTEEIKDKVEYFDEIYMLRTKTAGVRMPISKELQKIFDEINDTIEHYKDYLKEDHGRLEYKMYFAQSGIEKTSRGMKLPSDRDKTIKAVDKLIVSIEKYGYGSRKYGTEYWTDIRTRIFALVGQSKGAAGSISRQVLTKNELRIELRIIQGALANLIKAYHPKDWETVLREFGFLREGF